MTCLETLTCTSDISFFMARIITGIRNAEKKEQVQNLCDSLDNINLYIDRLPDSKKLVSKLKLLERHLYLAKHNHKRALRKARLKHEIQP